MVKEIILKFLKAKDKNNFFFHSLMYIKPKDRMMAGAWNTERVKEEGYKVDELMKEIEKWEEKKDSLWEKKKYLPIEEGLNYIYINKKKQKEISIIPINPKIYDGKEFNYKKEENSNSETHYKYFINQEDGKKITQNELDKQRVYWFIKEEKGKILVFETGQYVFYDYYDTEKMNIFPLISEKKYIDEIGKKEQDIYMLPNKEWDFIFNCKRNEIKNKNELIKSVAIGEDYETKSENEKITIVVKKGVENLKYSTPKRYNTVEICGARGNVDISLVNARELILRDSKIQDIKINNRVNDVEIDNDCIIENEAIKKIVRRKMKGIHFSGIKNGINVNKIAAKDIIDIGKGYNKVEQVKIDEISAKEVKINYATDVEIRKITVSKLIQLKNIYGLRVKRINIERNGGIIMSHSIFANEINIYFTTDFYDYVPDTTENFYNIKRSVKLNTMLLLKDKLALDVKNIVINIYNPAQLLFGIENDYKITDNVIFNLKYNPKRYEQNVLRKKPSIVFHYEKKNGKYYKGINESDGSFIMDSKKWLKDNNIEINMIPMTKKEEEKEYEEK